ncbi:MAG: LysM peptidoglycan-binding domain-containing protein [Candidatus Shapirobacteria bacterium]
MNSFKAGKKIFKSSEEVVSMFLGLAIVVVIVGLVFSFFQKRKGDITLPGVSNNIDISKVEDNKKADSVNKENVYTVVRGDSLWKIAKAKYNDGNKWTELAKTNNLKNPRVLVVGQKINLIQTVSQNTAKTTTGEQTISKGNAIGGGEYTVVKNDNLWKIAVKSYGDGYKWTKIWEANKKMIGNPGVIYVGTKLVIPKL